MASNNSSKEDDKEMLDYDKKSSAGETTVKVICLGDSAVGKSKLVERFLIDGYKPEKVSTYAVNLYRYRTVIDEEPTVVDFWDTAGQERFKSMHPSYYHQAHACIFVFDATRKNTYKNLNIWHQELRQHRPQIPCFCAVNKIDENMEVTQKSFVFPTKHHMPLYYVSACDGTNVVKMFRDAISAAVNYKKNPSDFIDMVLDELDATSLDDEST